MTDDGVQSATAIERADKTLKFAPQYEHRVQDGLKTATVRYNDEKDITEGDLLKCKTDDRPFARVEVTDVQVAEVRKAVELIRRMDEKHGADDWKELLEALNSLYDDKIWATTPVKAIAFEVIG